MTNNTKLHFPTTATLEDLAWALAGGQHDLGADATRAGYALIMWPGRDCPWFVPGPSAPEIEIAPFDGFDADMFL